MANKTKIPNKMKRVVLPINVQKLAVILNSWI
jgi:hypothetical protein